MSTNALDLDFAPIQLIGQQRQEDHNQLTQEFILTSPAGETFEFLAGAFYQDEELLRRGDLEIVLNGIGPVFAGNPLEPFIQLGLGDVTLVRNFTQDQKSISAFGQLTWHASDSLRFTLGARASEDEKTLVNKSVYAAAFTDTDYVPFSMPNSLAHMAFYDQFLSVR